jgi:hypothetical protein
MVVKNAQEIITVVIVEIVHAVISVKNVKMVQKYLLQYLLRIDLIV